MTLCPMKGQNWLTSWITAGAESDQEECKQGKIKSSFKTFQ